MERAVTKTRSAKTNQFVLSQGFNLGALYIRFYGLLMACSVLLGYFVGQARARARNIPLPLFEDISFWVIIISFLSARAYYVIFYWQFYASTPAEIFKIWHGGLAIYGAVIGGGLALLYFTRRSQSREAPNKITFLELADTFTFALPLAQALGRFGNYFNYEAFGAPTNLPWKMFVPIQFRPQAFQRYVYFHPTFLYEAIWDVLTFVVLYIIHRKQTARTAQTATSKQIKAGTITAAYFFTYSLGRFFIEALRLDSAYLWGFKIDQITALLLICASLGIMIKAYATQHN